MPNIDRAGTPTTTSPDLMVMIRKVFVDEDIAPVPEVVHPHPKAKGWESTIPHPDPFLRPLSSPSGAARARARRRRKP